MSDFDNVIGINRKPFSPDEPIVVTRKEDREKEEKLSESIANMLRALDETRALVEQGKLEGLILIGRCPTTQYFYSQMVLQGVHFDRHDLFSYMGYLDALKLEMSDTAILAPFITNTGAIDDPYQEEDVR